MGDPLSGGSGDGTAAMNPGRASDAGRLRVVPTGESGPQSLLFPRPQAFWVRRAVASQSLPTGLAPWQAAVKRVLDLGLGMALLFLSLPVVIIAAIAIKVEDGGPIFYRQTRVGRRSRPFTIFKLRTMVPGAELHLDRLASSNVRTGPLFKIPADPRVTRVGRLLRSSSIDELPQLLNVLQGTMSLVGPRPALPAEVAQFDEPLMARLDVKPGVTGLWQVEARDDPAFERYQNLDLYYVRYWNLRLDLAILMSTIRPVLHRLYRSARRGAATLALPVAGVGEGTASQVLD
jgi:lipopolysaccharide/colanic/teichoic acid biosynthesis glycosyltransferase